MKLDLTNVFTATGLGVTLTCGIKRRIPEFSPLHGACHASRGFRVRYIPPALGIRKKYLYSENALPSAETGPRVPGAWGYRAVARAVLGADVPELIKSLRRRQSGSHLDEGV